MRRVIAFAAAIAIVTAAHAQGAPLAFDVYVETHRPKMALRTLTPAEQAAARKAIAAWNSRKTEDNLLAVKPWAEAGYPDAMKTMVKGYEHLQKSKKDRGASAALARPETGLMPMTGIWAIRTGATLGWNKALAKTAQLCISPKIGAGGGMASVMENYHCGLEISHTTLCAIDSASDGIATSCRGDEVEDVPVLSEAGVRDARAENIFTRFGNNYRKQWASISKAERDWITAQIASDPEMRARYDAARFKMYVRGALKGDTYEYSPEKDWLEQYAAADSKRANELANASADYRNTLARDRANFGARMASATENDRYSLAQVALREGGQFAAAWYEKYGSTLKPGDYSVYQWCDRGVARACDDARIQDAQLKASADRVKAEDDKRLHRPDSAGSGGGGESVAAYGERVNSENCARADLGASIICNRN